MKTIYQKTTNIDFWRF